LTCIDELADAIRHRVPPDLIPDGDTSLFRVYLVSASPVTGRNVTRNYEDRPARLAATAGGDTLDAWDRSLS
jgi:hypothetical protein